MKLQGILPFTRDLLAQRVNKGDLVVDATMGNGLDTLFLAKLVGEAGQILAYDVQQEALDHTRERLMREKIATPVELMLKGHETVAEELQHAKKPLAAAMFNLGYRPGSDKSIVTVPQTTLQAIQSLCQYLKPNGLITLVIYSGHESGKQEKDQLLARLGTWDQKEFDVLQYQFINQQNSPPFLLVIQKK
ncbi:tRNA (mnm(5)s(2)U34)-methyltransferase [Bacillus horti]|uniref:tRNA A58 N-methylase Trm61 n=1 Tax=Caldalkalibacillus horti TaxID=77523 RepID=A0ABT9VWQ5_9BACI|nr:class I SAM-dependent methyltransferase [Bacillus horti]MDQ0165408.1 tRNA A58 N-methylase Trm61 [Bacillus horti]